MRANQITNNDFTHSHRRSGSDKRSSLSRGPVAVQRVPPRAAAPVLDDDVMEPSSAEPKHPPPRLRMPRQPGSSRCGIQFEIILEYVLFILQFGVVVATGRECVCGDCRGHVWQSTAHDCRCHTHPHP